MNKSCVKHNSWLRHNVHPKWRHDVQKCHFVLISIKLQRLFPEYYVPLEVINKLTLKRASNNILNKVSGWNQRHFQTAVVNFYYRSVKYVMFSREGALLLFLTKINPSIPKYYINENFCSFGVELYTVHYTRKISQTCEWYSWDIFYVWKVKSSETVSRNDRWNRINIWS